MKFTGTVIKEQVRGTDTTFAVIVVTRKIIHDRDIAARTARDFQQVFPGLPIVLMAQDSSGTPTYVGRPDLVWFLADVPIGRIPWKEYSL